MTSALVFAFEDDGTLSLYGDLEKAQTAYEGVDVENGVVKFYGRDGMFLEPVFTVPNRRGKLFGLLPWSRSGIYKLILNPAVKNDSFAMALLETSVLNPPLVRQHSDIKVGPRSRRSAALPEHARCP